jgi:hypothetical protein
LTYWLGCVMMEYSSFISFSDAIWRSGNREAQPQLR